MPQGLQVWDASGKLVLDITDRLTRCLGYANFSMVGSALSVDVPWTGITNDGTWGAIPQNFRHDVRIFAGVVRVYRWNTSIPASGRLLIFRY